MAETTKAVQLQKDHTHNGLLRPAGTFIELPAHLADWLVGQRIAKYVRPLARIEDTPPPRPTMKRGCCGR